MELEEEFTPEYLVRGRGQRGWSVGQPSDTPVDWDDDDRHFDVEEM